METFNTILFDIDRTLFDTDKFKKLNNIHLSKRLKIDITETEIALKEYIDLLEVSTDFDPKDFCYILSKRFDSKYEDLIEVFFGLKENYLKTRFKDSDAGLKKLRGEYNLGIFSQGNVDYQLHKLKELNLLKYFDKEYIFIMKRKTESDSILKLPKKSVIIDDNKEVIDQLLKHDLRPILIDRNKKVKNKKYLIIHDLRNLKTVLEIGN